MYQNLKSFIAIVSSIYSNQAMHFPIRANLVNDQRQPIAQAHQNSRNQYHNLVIIVKQLAHNHKLDLKELCLECHHFKITNGRLPIISEAVQIAADLKKQYIRQEEISHTIMNHIFVDQETIQSPSLDGYNHADSIVDHLGI